MKKLIIMMLLMLFSINNYSQIKKTSINEAVGYKSFNASWYCLSGKTASGSRVQNGVIAVDPKVIKLGTQVHILGFGNFIAKDTGGAIKGNRIDIWTPSCSNALKLGRKKVQLKVIK